MDQWNEEIDLMEELKKSLKAKAGRGGVMEWNEETRKRLELLSLFSGFDQETRDVLAAALEEIERLRSLLRSRDERALRIVEEVADESRMARSAIVTSCDACDEIKRRLEATDG